MPMRAMMYEKMSVGLGWLSMVGGTLTAGFYSAKDAIAPPLATLDPNSISTAVVIGTNALAAVSGAGLLAYGAWRKKRREEKAADDIAFAASWEGKFGDLQKKYDLLKQELAVTSEKLDVTKQERDFVRTQLANIQIQNAKQTKKINAVAANVKAVGDAIHAPMSDDGEGTDADIPVINDPESIHDAPPNLPRL